MIVPPNFTPGKKYALDGATLQALFDAVATCQILPSDEYELDISPKKGTRLMGIKGKGSAEGRWDLIPSGTGYIVRDPLVLSAYGAITALAITNAPITPAADKWVVLQINDVSADPYTFTVAVVSAEADGSLKVYDFDSGDDLTSVRLPLHYLSDEEIAGAAKIGEIWALKYVSSAVQTLASHSVVVPSRPISRSVPRLISL